MDDKESGLHTILDIILVVIFVLYMQKLVQIFNNAIKYLGIIFKTLQIC
mgnify:CR=1 FL=1